MNVKELKEFLSQLPAEADGWNVNFMSDDNDGVYELSGASEASWDMEGFEEKDKESISENFILLYVGKLDDMSEPEADE